MPRKKAIDFRLEGNAEIPFSCTCPYCNESIYGEIDESDLNDITTYLCYKCDKEFIINTKKK